MTRDEAKKILVLYRPGVTDISDSQMAAALELVQRDPELAAWFEQQCAVFEAIRGQLKSIPVPAGLREQIVAEHKAANRILSLTSKLLLASAVAALVLLAAILWSRLAPDSPTTFDGFRDRLARSVQRGSYFMEMHAADQAKIRDYFGSKGAPTDYVLPAALEKLPGEGGAVLTWQGHQVSLLCLDASNSPGVKNELYLFMVNRAVLHDAPAPGKAPQFLTVNHLMTMAWAVGDKVYLLAGSGDQAALQKYLE